MGDDAAAVVVYHVHSCGCSGVVVVVVVGIQPGAGEQLGL